ncbi:MAG TPA: site-specific integrase, partial [Actinobacteria bacterium]|nr:site-specific integrase [Actinomycetota bacterium]
MIRAYPKTGRLVYAYNYARGKKINIGLADGALTPTQAREKAGEIRADVIKGADPQEAKRKAKAHTLESFIINVYAPWVMIHHRDGRATINMIKANFLATLGKNKLTDINPWNIEKWRSERLKTGSRPASINRYLNALKAALSRAVDWDLIKENQLRRVKPLKTDSKAIIRYLTDTEEARLRAALDKREALIRQERANANKWRAERGYKLFPDLADGFADYLKPMIFLSMNTGLRRGELFNLKWADVDMDRAMLTVKGEGAKSGQTRHIPLNDEALAVLTTWQAQTDGELVYTAKDGGRFDNVNSSWRRLLKEAAITDFRFHDLRHHFASRLVMAGVDLN